MSELEPIKTTLPDENPRVVLDILAFRWNSTIDELQILMFERKSEPFKEKFSLFREYLTPNDDYKSTIISKVKQTLGLDVEPDMVNQLLTVTTPNRDPRGWVVSMVSSVYLPHSEDLDDALQGYEWVTVKNIKKKGQVRLELSTKEFILEDFDFAFDHLELITEGINTISNRLTKEPKVLKVLPKPFSLLQGIDLMEVFDYSRYSNMYTGNFKKNFKNILECVGVEKEEEGAKGTGRPKSLYELTF